MTRATSEVEDRPRQLRQMSPDQLEVARMHVLYGPEEADVLLG
jgi:hypothetical protein